MPVPNPPSPSESSFPRNFEIALFDGDQTIPRDGNYGYCIAGEDANNFVVIASEFSGTDLTGCTFAIGRRGAIEATDDC